MDAARVLFMTDRLPRTRQLLRAGLLDWTKVRTVLTCTQGLDDQVVSVGLKEQQRGNGAVEALEHRALRTEGLVVQLGELLELGLGVFPLFDFGGIELPGDARPR